MVACVIVSLRCLVLRVCLVLVCVVLGLLFSAGLSAKLFVAKETTPKKVTMHRTGTSREEKLLMHLPPKSVLFMLAMDIAQVSPGRISPR